MCAVSKRCVAVAFAFAAGLRWQPAAATDEFAASLRLRGGYDTNPIFSNGGGVGGSAFIGSDTALAAARKEDNYNVGVAAEAGDTQYSNRLVVPALSGKVVLRGQIGDDNLNVSSTTTIADVNNYSVRSSDLIESIKGEAKTGGLKIFATVEGARSSLNQTNAIFQDFLPEPQQYLRGTVIPGVSYSWDKFEVGTSVNVSVRRYLEEFDVFGFKRDNERVQPFVFASYKDGDLTLSGAVSQLYGTWHDPYFSNVRAVLFDAKASWKIEQVSVDLSASRRANETTFPISPITIDSAYVGKLTWQVDPANTMSFAAGYGTSLYLDSPFSSKTWTAGVGATHDFGNDLALGLDLTYAQGLLISGDRSSAVVISSSLTKKFNAPPKDDAKDVIKTLRRG